MRPPLAALAAVPAIALGVWAATAARARAAEPAATPAPAGAPATGVTLPLPPDVVAPGQSTGTVEALDPQLVEKERRVRIQALITLCGLVAGVAGYLAWRRIRTMLPEAIRVEVGELPESAAPGDTLCARVRVRTRAALRHDGIAAVLVYREHPGPRASKGRFAEREVARREAIAAGTIPAGEEVAAEVALPLPADAQASYDHAFAVDLPPGQKAIRLWAVRAIVQVGGAEVHGERLVRVEARAAPATVVS